MGARERLGATKGVKKIKPMRPFYTPRNPPGPTSVPNGICSYEVEQCLDIPQICLDAQFYTHSAA